MSQDTRAELALSTLMDMSNRKQQQLDDLLHPGFEDRPLALNAHARKLAQQIEALDFAIKLAALFPEAKAQGAQEEREASAQRWEALPFDEWEPKSIASTIREGGPCPPKR